VTAKSNYRKNNKHIDSHPNPQLCWGDWKKQ